MQRLEVSGTTHI